MTAILPAVLALLQVVAPALEAGKIQSVINLLIQIIPIAVKEAQDLVQPVKNIIAALSDNGGTTAEQLATLKALDQLTDSAFEEAARKALAEDAAQPPV